MNKKLENAKKEIEASFGQKLPKGICLCELDNGNVGVIYTKDMDPVEQENFELKVLLLADEDQMSSEGKLRAQCTGNYVKID